MPGPVIDLRPNPQGSFSPAAISPNREALKYNEISGDKGKIALNPIKDKELISAIGAARKAGYTFSCETDRQGDLTFRVLNKSASQERQKRFPSGETLEKAKESLKEALVELGFGKDSLSAGSFSPAAVSPNRGREQVLEDNEISMGREKIALDPVQDRDLLAAIKEAREDGYTFSCESDGPGDYTFEVLNKSASQERQKRFPSGETLEKAKESLKEALAELGYGSGLAPAALTPTESFADGFRGDLTRRTDPRLDSAIKAQSRAMPQGFPFKISTHDSNQQEDLLHKFDVKFYESGGLCYLQLKADNPTVSNRFDVRFNTDHVEMVELPDKLILMVVDKAENSKTKVTAIEITEGGNFKILAPWYRDA